MTEQQTRVATLHTVRVPREKLIAKLKEKREQHKLEIKEAMKGYYRDVAEKLEELMATTISSFKRNLERAQSGDPDTRTSWPALAVKVTKPVDHTDDFDRAIVRLEWEVANEVDLQVAEFDSYVLNKWPWLQQHVTSVSSFAPQFLANY